MLNNLSYRFLESPPPTQELPAPTHVATNAADIDILYHLTAFRSGKMGYYEFAKQMPKVETFLEHYRAEYPRLSGPPSLSLNEDFIRELGILAKRLENLPEDTHRNQLAEFSFLFYWSLIALCIETEGTEFEWWQERLSEACCVMYLNHVSACIRLLAGHSVDDRQAYLARLRPGYQQALAKLTAGTSTCGCMEGLANA